MFVKKHASAAQLLYRPVHVLIEKLFERFQNSFSFYLKGVRSQLVEELFHQLSTLPPLLD